MADLPSNLAVFIARMQRLPEPGSELLPGFAVGDV
ncbi:hypothetical protein QFZ60_002416 [Arthrobacter sp. B2I5]|nr:hypothetical protein [Arthrobacter sp. B2I5]